MPAPPLEGTSGKFSSSSAASGPKGPNREARQETRPPNQSQTSTQLIDCSIGHCVDHDGDQDE
jgi:hypothetical protein